MKGNTSLWMKRHRPISNGNNETKFIEMDYEQLNCLKIGYTGRLL